jgi:predicted RNA-binding protein YlqC (UPF0109 family)
MNRTDLYTLSADVALEQAIATLRAVETRDEGKLIGRKEAIRFLVKRLLRKDTHDRMRPVAANTAGISQY